MFEELQRSTQSPSLSVVLLTVPLGGSGCMPLQAEPGRTVNFLHPQSIQSSVEGVVGSEALDSKEVRIFVCLGHEASSKMEAFVF